MQFNSMYPANGEVMHAHTADTFETVSQKTAKAREAQLQWATVPDPERFNLLYKFKSVIEKKIPDILSLIHKETGKLPADGEAEIYDVLGAFDYYTNLYSSLKMPSIVINKEVFPGTEAWLEHEPFGVLALIMPWNFSFYSPMMFVIAGVTAGNAIVLKPSEYSTLVGIMIKDLWNEAGLPSDLLQIVMGDETAGKLLVKSGCDKIFFVGSVEGGRDVIANAGITPVQVELGGNSAAIVMPDANLEHAVQGIAWGATYSSGQDCAGIKRVYAHSSIVEKFKAKLVEVVSSLRQGIDYGPYITDEARSVVVNRLTEAQKKGAKILIGGEIIRPGFWLTPSVIEVADENVALITEETFGNVIPIITFNDEAELVAKVNNTKYGLSSAIFSADNDKALLLGRKLQSGMLFVNDPFVSPVGWDHWTGWKSSGFGTMDSKLSQCLRKRLVTSSKSNDSRTFWYPYS